MKLFLLIWLDTNIGWAYVSHMTKMHRNTSRSLSKREGSGFLRPALALVAIFAFSMCVIFSSLEKSLQPNLSIVDNPLCTQAIIEQDAAPALISHEGPSFSQARDRSGQAKATESSTPKFCLPFLAEFPSFPGNVPVITFFAPLSGQALLLPGPEGPIPFSLPPPLDFCA